MATTRHTRKGITRKHLRHSGSKFAHTVIQKRGKKCQK